MIAVSSVDILGRKIKKMETKEKKKRREEKRKLHEKGRKTEKQVRKNIRIKRTTEEKLQEKKK